ncbi:L,D-transpeptidase family protein [Altererythrobacter confluentis]|uniref:L,D-transpeptidase family protein n=1 Tax=Allopontixanthobacter confluentis TaxID=1849021 RepID=A0A6L7GJ24_9SPHN|nr:L,D-transpeptidase family protein [Allopontixanthobacter confluentis]MXP15585.1 L,D-transpeptidase family protein [Allopontixanthobacter confluentis]
MTFSIRISLLATAALAVAAPLSARQAAPANLLPQDAEAPAKQESKQPAAANAVPVSAPAQSVAEAFSQEMVQDIPSITQPWSLGNAKALVTLIDGIGAEGLDKADYNPAELRAAIALGESEQLNELASQTFAWLVEDLRDGRTPMDARKQWFVFDPDADRYPISTLMTQALESGDLEGTLAQIMPEHPDYALLKAELAKTPVAKAGHRKMIRANMDRWRWLARELGSQYLMTNVPEFQLRLTVNDNIVRTYKTVVGKPGRTATPQLAESVEGVIFNPTWTVPQSIVKGEGLGARVLGNPSWARRAGYTATKGENGWVSVVQQPGPTNSLGLMKLDMPNRHAIFLHDTPSRSLFANANRALSHGCIRTERATELAITLAILQGGLTPEEGVGLIKGGEYTKVGFQKTMPVYITYFTMAKDIDGKLSTFADIYDRDAPVLASLDAPRKPNRSRVTGEQIIVIEDDLQT